MRKQIFFGIVGISLLLSCNNSVSKPDQISKNNDSTLVKKDSGLAHFEIMDEIQLHMTNKVVLDTLLKNITKQKNVKFITELKEDWNDTTKTYIYAADNYRFELRVNEEDQSAIFKDGSVTIKFRDHKPLCPQDPVFKCPDYGFNIDNSLKEPRIIEAAGHQFLYSDVSYWCNGIGCGCFITFIYDLQKKKATFLENYRIPFDGFYVSDFDNDNNPDLLVISKSQERQMQGFNFEEFDVKLSWYYYDDGVFKIKLNNLFPRPYCYEMYSFVPFYHHSYHDDIIYSITKDNWTE